MFSWRQACLVDSRQLLVCTDLLKGIVSWGSKLSFIFRSHTVSISELKNYAKKTKTCINTWLHTFTSQKQQCVVQKHDLSAVVLMEATQDQLQLCHFPLLLPLIFLHHLSIMQSIKKLRLVRFFFWRGG